METSIYTSWFDQAPSDALQCLLGGLWRHSSVTQRFGLLLDIPNMIKKMALDETPMDWNLKWPCKLRFGLGFEYVDIYTCLVSMYIYIYMYTVYGCVQRWRQRESYEYLGRVLESKLHYENGTGSPLQMGVDMVKYHSEVRMYSQYHMTKTLNWTPKPIL
jgi:hypothetical protein